MHECIIVCNCASTRAQGHNCTRVCNGACTRVQAHDCITVQLHKCVQLCMYKSITAQDCTCTRVQPHECTRNKLFKTTSEINENDYFCTDFGDGFPSASITASLRYRLRPSFTPGSFNQDRVFHLRWDCKLCVCYHKTPLARPSAGRTSLFATHRLF